VAGTAAARDGSDGNCDQADQPARNNAPRGRRTLRCLTSWIRPRPTVRCARPGTRDRRMRLFRLTSPWGGRAHVWLWQRDRVGAGCSTALQSAAL